MSDERSVTRRRLLAAGSAAAVGLAASSLPGAGLLARETQAPCRLPARVLGRTGFRAAVLAGNESLMRAGLVDLAVRAGVNYWHDAQRMPDDFARSLARAGRDSHLIEVSLPPTVGGAARRADEFERLLSARGIDFADVLEMRGWDEAVAEGFGIVKRRGAARFLSARCDSCDDALAAVESGAVDLIEVPAPPTAGGPLGRVLAAAAARNVGVTLTEPLDGALRGDDGALANILGPYTAAGLTARQAAVRYSLAAAGVAALDVRFSGRGDFGQACRAACAAGAGLALRTGD